MPENEPAARRADDPSSVSDAPEIGVDGALREIPAGARATGDDAARERPAAGSGLDAPGADERRADTHGADAQATDVEGADTHGAGAHGADAARIDAPAPPPSRYARMAENTSVRNIVWALGMTMAVVAVVAMLFFGVGNDPHREIPESQRVDVAATARRAQELAPFPIAVPELPAAWSAKAARYADGADPRWSARYAAPSGALVTLAQGSEITPTLLHDAAADGRTAGTVDVEGISCEVLESGDDQGTRALVCPGEGWGLVVSGRAEQSELAEMARAAITSARG